MLRSLYNHPNALHQRIVSAAQIAPDNIAFMIFIVLGYGLREKHGAPPSSRNCLMIVAMKL